MSAFLDETGTLITVDHSNPLPVALVAGFTSLNDGELKTASYANPLPVTVVTTNYTEEELPDADSVAVGTEIFNTTYQVKMRSNGTSWEWLGIGKSTWANKPATAPLGQVICITDIGEDGSLWRGNGTKWNRLHAISLYRTTTEVYLTGTTTETTLATVTIPAGVMGPNGRLVLHFIWSFNNSAGAKTLRVKLDNQNCSSIVQTTTAYCSTMLTVQNINSESLQKTPSGLSAGVGASSGVINTTTVNTAVNAYLTFTGQLASGTDNISLVALYVEVV